LPSCAAVASDYKALVCFSSLAATTPTISSSRPIRLATALRAGRGALALPQASALAVNVKTSDGHLRLHRDGGGRDLFNQASSLSSPMWARSSADEQDAIQRRSVPLPPQLFSHNDQQSSGRAAFR